MSYLRDYIYYNSGTEVPESYCWWAGLSLLGHILGNKTWIVHGDYFRFPPNLYICLVGDAGSGKNTGLSVNMEIMIEQFPELMMSASIQSREDIAQLMASDECTTTWQDRGNHLGKGASVYHTYRPFYILNNELASFLSVDRIKMVEFLTEVYDGKRFGTGFKGDRKDHPDRKQWFDNPHVSLIAGAVPTYFMGSLKIDLFERGLGRRLFIVYDQRTKIVPSPKKPEGADLALSRAIEFLKKAKFKYGAIRLDDKASLWWDEWYRRNRNKPPEDPILSQFHQTKHMQLLKISMLMCLAENIEATHVTGDHLEAGLALIESLEGPIIRLTSGIGRNENAGIATEIMMAIEAADGMLPRKKVLALFFRQTPGGMPKLDELLTFLQKTDKLIPLAPKRTDGSPDLDRAVLFTPARFERYQKDGK